MNMNKNVTSTTDTKPLSKAEIMLLITKYNLPITTNMLNQYLANKAKSCTRKAIKNEYLTALTANSTDILTERTSTFLLKSVLVELRRTRRFMLFLDKHINSMIKLDKLGKASRKRIISLFDTNAEDKLTKIKNILLNDNEDKTLNKVS